MKKLRILTLMHEDLVPPEDVSGFDVSSVEWKTEFDVTQSLKEMGHDVKSVGLRSDLGIIKREVQEYNPHIVFNLVEEFDGEAVFDQHVVSYLELLGLPYTGCSPRGLMLARDKALSKKVLSYHRIPVPEFIVFPMGKRKKAPRKAKYPLIVKSLIEEASLGISQASLVHDEKELLERVSFVHTRLGTDAIAEEYIHGRELYLGIIGNVRLRVFPIWELLFNGFSQDAPRIATAKVKWDHKYQEEKGIASGQATGLSDAQQSAIVTMGKKIYRILGLTGYARVDLRMKENGEVFVLEANPNPQLAYGEDFAESAEKDGLDYKELLQKIINLGLNRKKGI